MNLGDEFFGIRKTFFGAQIEEQIEKSPVDRYISPEKSGGAFLWWAPRSVLRDLL